jgi:Peptidase A4 family
MATVDTPTGLFYDEDKFLQKSPVPLKPTNLKGAYISPAPSAGFDPNKASAAELIKNGVTWRRPGANDDPKLTAAWQKVFSRKWRPEDRIVPVLEPQPGKTHILKTQPRKVSDQNFLNGAWSGGGTRGGGPWTGIIGYWDIPTVSKPSEPQGTEPGGGWKSSSWLGLDGFDIGIVSDDVLQAGIEQYVAPNGQASYVAWFEWYAPAQSGSPGYIYQTNITNFPVAPGQQMYCSVSYVNNNTAGSIYLANEATGQHFSITLAPPPGATFAGNTFEWIMEAPDGGEPFTSLPKFTPVVFTSAIACTASGTTGNPQTGDTVNVETPSGKVLTSVTLGSDTLTIDFIG